METIVRGELSFTCGEAARRSREECEHDVTRARINCVATKDFAQ